MTSNDRAQLRQRILDLVRDFHAADEPRSFVPGRDSVRYAGRHFDAEVVAAFRLEFPPAAAAPLIG